MHKALTNVQIKSADRGEVSAVFSTFNVKDRDGDVTVPGAIKDGTEVVISAYGHRSHTGMLPVGKGVIRTTDSEAVLEGKFFLDTTDGRETFSVVKQLGPLQEWSYSLHDVVAERGEFNGEVVRFLKSIRVKEVSPVLVGSGVNTRTTRVKAAPDDDDGGWGWGGAIPVHETATSEARWAKSTEPPLSVDALRFAHAWVDLKGDPASAASYRLAHHDEHGANVRACVMGIARLASGRSGLPEEDVKGAYEHLAAHLRDADREPVSLTVAHNDGAIVKSSHELASVLADLAALNDRMTEVGASRAAKGKGFTGVQRELIEWLADETRRTRALLDNHSDEAQREYARYIALTTGVM